MKIMYVFLALSISILLTNVGEYAVSLLFGIDSIPKLTSLPSNIVLITLLIAHVFSSIGAGISLKLTNSAKWSYSFVGVLLGLLSIFLNTTSVFREASWFVVLDAVLFYIGVVFGKEWTKLAQKEAEKRSVV